MKLICIKTNEDDKSLDLYAPDYQNMLADEFEESRDAWRKLAGNKKSIARFEIKRFRELALVLGVPVQVEWMAHESDVTIIDATYAALPKERGEAFSQDPIEKKKNPESEITEDGYELKNGCKLHTERARMS